LRRYKKKYLDFAPSLVVEILSPATALRDRHTKFELYRQQGVKYYLIVDADEKSIEIFMLKNAVYALQKFNKSYTFDLENNYSITPHLSNIFE
jgi:Uma2 family endonuclease